MVNTNTENSSSNGQVILEAFTTHFSQEDDNQSNEMKRCMIVYDIFTCKKAIRVIIKFENFVLKWAVALIISSIYKWNNILKIINAKQ